MDEEGVEEHGEETEVISLGFRHGQQRSGSCVCFLGRVSGVLTRTSHRIHQVAWKRVWSMSGVVGMEGGGCAAFQHCSVVDPRILSVKALHHITFVDSSSSVDCLDRI